MKPLIASFPWQRRFWLRLPLLLCAWALCVPVVFGLDACLILFASQATPFKEVQAALWTQNIVMAFTIVVGGIACLACAVLTSTRRLVRVAVFFLSVLDVALIGWALFLAFVAIRGVAVNLSFLAQSMVMVVGMAVILLLLWGVIVFSGRWAWGALLLVWALLIATEPTLPMLWMTILAYGLVAVISLMTLALSQWTLRRVRWAERQIDVAPGVHQSSFRVVGAVSLLMAVWVISLPLLNQAQWPALTQTIATIRDAISQINPIVRPGQSGPPRYGFGVLNGQMAAGGPTTAVVLRYRITALSSAQRNTAPPFDVIALDQVDNANVWTTRSSPFVALAAQAGLAAVSTVPGSALTERIQLARPLAEGWLPTPETAFVISLPTRAATLETQFLPQPLSVEGYKSIEGGTTGSLAYTVQATALQPASASVHAVLSNSVFASLTFTPTALRMILLRTAQAWVGNARTPEQQGDALIAAMRSQLRLTPANPSLDRRGNDAVLSLITQRRGDAYAWVTTFALLMRALGVPSRIMQGFTPGAYDKASGEQVVRASDATFWPQIALDASGWYTLDPTAHAIPLSRVVPSSSRSTTSSGSQPAHHTAQGAQKHQQGSHSAQGQSHSSSSSTSPFPTLVLPPAMSPTHLWWAAALAVLLVVLVMLLYFVVLHGRRKEAGRWYMATQPTRRLLWWAVRLGITAPCPGETTREALERLAQTLFPLWPAAFDEARWLADRYDEAAYRSDAFSSNTRLALTVRQRAHRARGFVLRAALHQHRARIFRWMRVSKSSKA